MSIPAGVDVDTLHFLERHETRVHALPGREMRELGDAVLLFDPLDREPFWNRVGAIRWPQPAGAFDRRVAETIALFAGLDRTPHIWPRPAFNEPPDLVDRLLASGWADVGGGLLMLLTDADAAVRAEAAPLGPGVSIERLAAGHGDGRRRASADFSLVLAESFELELSRRAAIELESRSILGRVDVTGYLVRVDGEPAAVAKRTTFDGASYLSSVGTRPGFRGRGLGRVVTAAAAADAVRAGVRWTYLGVFTGNEPAIRLYRRLGFEAVGGTTPDLLLR